MLDFTIEHVSTEHDYMAAFNLALSVFSPQNSSIDYGANKFFTWDEDPYFKYENILLAKYKGIPAGLIRIVPRELFRVDKVFSVAGISSVCLLPEYRGKGLSVILMDEALRYCKGLGYDISLLFARRNADYYYTRFGFHGISSYSQISVKKPQQLNVPNRYSFADGDLNLLEIYAQAYDKTYANCFGKFQRTPEYWKFLFVSLSYKPHCHNRIIKFNGRAIGYIISDSKKILEIATTEDIFGKEFILFLMENLEISTGDSLQFEMLPQHSMVKQLYGLDVTFQSRGCIFGGHMLKVINEENVRLKLNPPSLDFGLKNRKDILSHAETCDLLRVTYPTLQSNSDSLIPFDISSIDHF
jgi:GNAT superfamily N-acetyltransferase